MAQISESELPHKDCPKCGTSILRTETPTSYIIRLFFCQRCEYEFTEVCFEGQCDDCREKTQSCGECSYCMNKVMVDNYRGTHPSGE